MHRLVDTETTSYLNRAHNVKSVARMINAMADPPDSAKRPYAPFPSKILKEYLETVECLCH